VRLAALLIATLLSAAACGPPADAAAPAFARRAPAPLAFAPPPSDVASTEPFVPSVAAPAPARASRCSEQRPHDFLIRGNYTYAAGLSPDARADRKKLHHRAIEYRTREYGHVEGFGDESWNRLEPKDYAKTGTFLGKRVKLNVRVLSALSCVEEDIVAECGATPYEPRMLDGLRTKNTFHDNEVSNHLYGIAIDIDPEKNSCCGCVTPGAHWSKCDVPGLTAYERTALPRCWIDAFERYGFYWLGHDAALEDTMHFEFLGDPDRIERKDALALGE
jgi:hypothetical protein